MSETGKKIHADPWMTTEEAADYLRISPGTVRNKVSAGEIPCHRRGRIVRFRRSELDEWLSGGAVGAEVD